MYAEMALAARPVSGVPLMQMRFVDNLDAFRRESIFQLLRDGLADAHGASNS
jgi:hypothetical protein